MRDRDRDREIELEFFVSISVYCSLSLSHSPSVCHLARDRFDALQCVPEFVKGIEQKHTR